MSTAMNISFLLDIYGTWRASVVSCLAVFYLQMKYIGGKI